MPAKFELVKLVPVGLEVTNLETGDCICNICRGKIFNPCATCNANNEYSCKIVKDKEKNNVHKHCYKLVKN